MEKLAIVQIRTEEQLTDNLVQIAHFAGEAVDAGCKALCFPECFLTGDAPEQAAQRSISRSDPALNELSALARQYNLDLLVGFMESDGNHNFITHGIFRPDGSRDYYRKTHLGEKEARLFTPGDRLEVFTLSCGIRCGIQLCLESHFPEITQTLSLKGADVIFAPYAAPGGSRQKIWEKYIPARSYDNRVYFACCNLFGGLYVTDPTGEVICSAFDGSPEMLTFEADPALVAQYRSNSSHRFRYYPSRRRPELY